MEQKLNWVSICVVLISSIGIAIFLSSYFFNTIRSMPADIKIEIPKKVEGLEQAEILQKLNILSQMCYIVDSFRKISKDEKMENIKKTMVPFLEPIQEKMTSYFSEVFPKNDK